MRKQKLLFLSVCTVVVSVSAPATAFEPMRGCVIAERACPAPSSLRRQSNPGGIALEVGRTYELLGANQVEATHLRIRIPSADPRDRWIEVSCGRTVEDCDVRSDGAGEPLPAPPAKASFDDNVLAASWQPAFCETHRQTPECASQTENRHDASHFALHGLWPQPQSNAYCGVGQADRSIDGWGRWDLLDPVELTPETRAALDEVMPGTRSFLDRHEWVKHGVCYSETGEEYYREAIRLVRELNASAVRSLFASNIGEQITLEDVRGAFDQAFGQGAGDRVTMECRRQAGRQLIVELKINLVGEIDETTRLADLLAAAPPAAEGCRVGEVDRAGFGPGR